MQDAIGIVVLALDAGREIQRTRRSSHFVLSAVPTKQYCIHLCFYETWIPKNLGKEKHTCNMGVNVGTGSRWSRGVFVTHFVFARDVFAQDLFAGICSPGFVRPDLFARVLFRPGFVSPVFAFVRLFLSPGVLFARIVSPGLFSPGFVRPGLFSPGFVSPVFVRPLF